jgi:CheY-like chemotaxis protein
MAEENSRAVKLLLVEDNPAEVQRLKEFLQEVAIPTTLHAVERGEVALAFLRNEGQYAEAPPPDVMVLDLDLLKMEGFQLLEEIENDPTLRVIPLVIFSGADCQKEHLVATILVATYLTKSLERTQYMELLGKIQRCHAGA